MNFLGTAVSRSNSSLFGHASSTLPSPIKSSSSDQIDSAKTSSPSSPPFKSHKICYPLIDAQSLSTGQVEWVGTTPLEVIQTIVSMAESSADFSSISGSNSRLRCGRSLLQNFLADAPSHCIDQHAGQKRKREYIEEDIDAGVEDETLAEALVDSVDMQHLDNTFNTWHPSSTAGESPPVTSLDSLVRNFERVVVDPTKRLDWCLPSYNRVQQAFISKVTDGDAEKVLLAVRNATAQMQVLTEMVSSVGKNKKPNVQAALRLERPGSKLTTNPSGEFNNLMHTFMVENFSNPFPDDAVLNRLSNHLIENRCIPLSKKDAKMLDGANPVEYRRSLINIATEKITNWLVNTRSRRWRPSIAKAFDGKRPVALLLEDSLNIFIGAKLRPLLGWDGDRLYSFDSRYATKLKTWKMKRQRRGAKGKKAEAFGESKKPGADPASFDDITAAQLDLSPCAAFLDAGCQMMLEDENDNNIADGTLGGDFAAI